MKIVLTLTLAAVLMFSCTSIKYGITDAIGKEVVKTISEPVLATAVSVGETDSESEPETAGNQASKPAIIEEVNEPTKEEVLEAVQNSDLEALKKMLADTADVKTIIGNDIPILVIAEESMGVAGMPNPVTEYLVEKKAYILQRDEKGRDIERIIQDFEVAATPRHDYVLSIIGDKKQQYWNAINTDSVDGIKQLLDYMPVDSNLLIDAARYKAPRVLQWTVSEGVDVNITDSKGQSVLHLACDNYRLKNYEDKFIMAKALIEAGADINALDKSAKTPLDNCSTEDLELYNYMVDAGAKSGTEL